jgi:uncharacterized membrane protein YhaH (DUF805 family)
MSSTPPPPPPPPPPGNTGGGYGGAPQPALSNPLVSYWKKAVLENYAEFSGRSRRAEFWWFALANFIVNIVFTVLGQATALFTILGFVYGLAVLIPGIAVGIRRLHDTGKSGWWLLIALIPFVGVIVLIVFMATDSTPGTNEWGSSPKYGG